MTRCRDEHQNLRCVKDAGHDGLHRNRLTAWGFREPVSPWVQRALTHTLIAKELGK